MSSGEETAIAMKKGPWTAEEDAMLMEYVRMNGEGNWNSVRKSTGLARCGKSCRLRWANHLRPNLKKGQFTAEEEFIIQRLHAQIGNKWARMAAQLPGRTDNEIKNYWNTRVKRRQRSGLPLYPPEVVHGQLQPLPPLLPGSKTAFSVVMPNFMGLGIGDGVSRAKRARHLPVEYGLMPMPMMPGYNSAESELPSSQAFGEGAGGGGGLLDVLLQGMNGGEEEEEMLLLGDPPADEEEEEEEGNAGDKEGFVETVGKFGNFCLELKSTEPIEEMNQETNDDISQLFETIPTPSMPLPDWNDNSSDEMSNGAQSGMSNDDLGLDLQQLASLFAAPPEPEWNIGSCNWNNMPEIC